MMSEIFILNTTCLGLIHISAKKNKNLNFWGEVM